MSQKIYVVEHLDPELEQWSSLEYQTIARECKEAGARFLLSSVPTSLNFPQASHGDIVEVVRDSVETMFAEQKPRICLLDPAASKELAPEDANDFDIFLFGGILGDDPPRGQSVRMPGLRKQS